MKCCFGIALIALVMLGAAQSVPVPKGGRQPVSAIDQSGLEGGKSCKIVLTSYILTQ